MKYEMTIIWFVILILTVFLLLWIKVFINIFWAEYLKYQSSISNNDIIYALYEHPASFQENPYLIVLKIPKKVFTETKKFVAHKKGSDWQSDVIITLYAWKWTKFIENTIEINTKGYLLLKSADLYYALYDLKSDSLIENITSPYEVWENEKEISISNNKEDFYQWVRDKIHNKILEIIAKER